MTNDQLIPLERDVTLPVGSIQLSATLALPASPSALVLFTHPFGDGRSSLGDAAVAGDLRGAGLGTLVFDLLTKAERPGRIRDVALERLAERIGLAEAWAAEQFPGLPIGYYATGTGAAAALLAAATEGARVGAVVCRVARPESAWEALPAIRAATLLVVGAGDSGLIAAHQSACRELRCINRLLVVPGAGPHFEDGPIQREVSRSARSWFVEHLTVGRRWIPRPDQLRPILSRGRVFVRQ